MIEISQYNPVTGVIEHSVEDMESMLEQAVLSADNRMIDMNMRMLEAYQFHQYMSEAEWVRVKQIMEVLCGRMQPQTLLSRWQSAQEETVALEANRQAHLEQQDHEVTDAFVNGIS